MIETQPICPICGRVAVAVARSQASFALDDDAAALGIRRMIRNPDRSGYIEHDDGACFVANVDDYIEGST